MDSDPSTAPPSLTAESATADPTVAALLALNRSAYQVAVRLLQHTADAEDVVQQAYLKVLAPPHFATAAKLPPDHLQPWFLRVVINQAKNHRREATRRKHRESAMESQPHQHQTELSPELTALLQQGLNELDETLRLPVVLCYEQGLTQKQVAELLNEPARTLSDRIAAGLEQLRASLARSGYTAAPAALIADLSHSAPPVPASLAVSLQQLAQQTMTATTAAAAATATTTVAAWKLLAAVGLVLVTLLAVVKVYPQIPPPTVAVAPSPAPTPTAAAAEPVPAPVPVQSAFVRPEIDPRLAANLDRTVTIRMPHPQPFPRAIEALERSLPPYETLAVRILPDWTRHTQARHDTEIGRDRDQRAGRPLTAPDGATTIRKLLDSFAQQMDMEWQATGDEIVFWPKYSEADAQRWFAAFGDAKQARAARQAAAANIVEANWPRGFAELLRKLHGADDADGAAIARKALADKPGALSLANEGLAAAVRAILTAEERTAIAAAELQRVKAAETVCRSPLALQLCGFLRHRDSVPVLIRSLNECQDVGGLFSALSPRGSRPEDLRATAASALGSIGGAEAVDALLAAQATEKAEGAKAAEIQALGGAGDPRAVEPLMKQLDPTGAAATTNQVVIQALGMLGDTRAEPAIIGLLTAQGENAYGIDFYQAAVAPALTRLHTATTAKSMQTLMREGRTPRVRQIATAALELFRDPKAVPDLLWVLENVSRDDWIMRMQAGEALARIGDPASFATLRQLALESPDEDVFRTAAGTLARVDHPAAAVALWEIFRETADENRLWQIGRYACAAQTPQTLLDTVKNDTVPMRRRLAAAAYGHSGGAEAWQTLLKLQAEETDVEARIGMLEGLEPAQTTVVHSLMLTLAKDSPDAKIRSTATGQLPGFVADDERVVAVLRQVLAGDEDAPVRMQAAYALTTILEQNPARWKTDRTSMTAQGRMTQPRRPDDPAPVVTTDAAITALQQQAVDGLVRALQKDPAVTVRRQIVNALFSLVSDPRPSPTRAKLTTAYLALLKTEPNADVQAGLAQSFFMRMREEPDLTDPMLAILQDQTRDREVRKQACQNLESMRDNAPARVKAALAAYKQEKATNQPPPATPEPEEF